MRASIPFAALALLAVASAPPRPATVTEVAADDGQLRVHPPVAHIEVDAGDGTTVPLQLRNGTDRTVRLALAAVTVSYDEEDGPAPTEAVTGAAGWVSFAEDEVVLPAGAQATVWPAVNVPAGEEGSHLVAVRASSATDQAVHALLAIDPGGATPSATAETSVERVGGRSDLVASLRNDGGAAAVVTVRSVVSSWTGRRLIDETIGPVVVPAGSQRQLRLGFRTPRVPAPYDVSTAVTATDGSVARASTSFVAWDPGTALTAVATGLVLIATWAWWRARRRPEDDDGSAAGE